MEYVANESFQMWYVSHTPHIDQCTCDAIVFEFVQIWGKHWRQPINKRQLIITNQPVFVIAKEIELNNNLVCASDVIAGLLSSGVISIN